MVKLYHKSEKMDITYVMFCNFYVENTRPELWNFTGKNQIVFCREIGLLSSYSIRYAELTKIF